MSGSKRAGTRNTVILALLFVLLCLYLVIISALGGSQKTDGGVLLPVSLGDIRSFTVYNDQLRTRFFREGNDWKAENFPEVPLSKQDVDSFLDSVMDINSRRKLENTGDLLPYGLDQSNMLIRISTAKRDWTLIWGAATASGREHYMLVNGEVHLAPSKFGELFAKDLFAFRLKQFFTFNSAHLVSIDITHQERRMVLAKSNKEWKLVLPVSKPVPQEKVNTFIFQLEDLMIKRFIEGGGIDLAYHGLPSREKIVLATDQHMVTSIMFGKKTENGYYAMKDNGTKTLYVVEPYVPESRLKAFMDEMLSPAGEADTENKR